MNSFVSLPVQQRIKTSSESLHDTELVKINATAVGVLPVTPASFTICYFRFCLPLPLPLPFAFSLPLPPLFPSKLTLFDEVLSPLDDLAGFDGERLADFRIERGVLEPLCWLRPLIFPGTFLGVGALLEERAASETIFTLCLRQSSSLSFTRKARAESSLILRDLFCFASKSSNNAGDKTSFTSISSHLLFASKSTCSRFCCCSLSLAIRVCILGLVARTKDCTN